MLLEHLPNVVGVYSRDGSHLMLGQRTQFPTPSRLRVQELESMGECCYCLIGNEKQILNVLLIKYFFDCVYGHRAKASYGIFLWLGEICHFCVINYYLLVTYMMAWQISLFYRYYTKFESSTNVNTSFLVVYCMVYINMKHFTLIQIAYAFYLCNYFYF